MGNAIILLYLRECSSVRIVYCPPRHNYSEVIQKLRDLIAGTTKVVVVDDDTFGPDEVYAIPVVECCKIGPIFEEKYCPKCGKRIVI